MPRDPPGRRPERLVSIAFHRIAAAWSAMSSTSSWCSGSIAGGADTPEACHRGGLWLVNGSWGGIRGLWRVSRVRRITLAVWEVTGDVDRADCVSPPVWVAVCPGVGGVLHTL